MAQSSDTFLPEMISSSDHIPDDGKTLRRVRESEAKASGQVRKAAFMPRAEGQDRDGLSVSIEDEGCREIHRAKYTAAGYRPFWIAVDAIRELKPLDVILRPQPDDPMHALIVGIPDRTQSTEHLAAAEHFAKELARKAESYTFPPRA